MIRVGSFAVVALLVAFAGLGLYRFDHGGQDWMQVALEREAALLAGAPYEGYGAGGYHAVQQALDRVPFWSPDHGRARAWSAAIAAARRTEASRRYPQLGLPDRGPTPGAGEVGADEPPGTGAPTGENEAESTPRVSVFVTSWCPYCRKLARHLDDLGVAYREVDIERDAAGRDELARKAPFAVGVPVLEIDHEILVGYDTTATDRMLRDAGLIPPKDS